VPDEPQAFSAGRLLVSVVNGGLSAVARRPLKVRAGLSVGSATRGRADVLLLELGGVQLDKLEIQRLLLRAEDAHLSMGLRPRLQATNVGLKVGKVVSEVEVDIGFNGSFLVLRPVRAAFLRRSTPVLPGFRWYLPLRLPPGASLTKVEHDDGELTAYLRLPDVDEAVTAAVARSLWRRLGPKLLSLGGSAARAAARRI
jgi:hypothetical protein